MGIVLFIVGVVVGLLAMRLIPQRLGKTSAEQPAPASDGALPAAETHDVQEHPRDRLFRLKREIEAQDDRIQHPQDLLAIAEFREGVDLLSGSDFTAADVIEHLGGSGYVLPSMAASALTRRTDSAPEAALTATAQFGGYPLRFVLDYLQTLTDASTLPLLLRHGREWWWDAQGVRQRLREYFRWAEAHAPGTTSVNLDDLDEAALTDLKEALKRFQEPVLAAFLAELDAALANRRERRVLGAFGRVMASGGGTQSLILHSELQSQADQLYEQLTATRPSPVLITGEPGVGKSVLIDILADRLNSEGWLVFEASAAEILAGQKYIGELEERVREMLGVLNRRRALWRVPDFFDLLAKGSHARDPRGILDLLIPAIERGELLLIGEITPRQLAQLLLARPSIRHLFEIVQLPPANTAVLADVAAQWAQAQADRLGTTIADGRTLAEATRMAAQYFPEQHEPGRLLRLLNETLQVATAQEPQRLPLDAETLLAAIAARSGLPREVIDDRQSLDLERLRGFFRQRVLGQDEAVDCLVDRIAMLKAGLVDSNRPIGVFLFAGPTGTGKTELAKALGELLFGSDERLLRLDMSEFQSEDSVWRLVGDEGGHGGVRSLTARIREQPFSVVLLDEFEKAHPRVWDLFLQVFDDARLTDRSGHTADFRHSIIILTSNAGSTISRTAGPGFTAGAGGYSRNAVEKVLFETFRREFLNRLDRIVLFKPLDRGLMREILHKELARVLTRRGLRNRDWAVEWEPSAIEFLLDRGFTPDLGARPLRRAIEHHLLAPLAHSIVEHRAPQGDQFLFVRSAGDRLEVQFIDPNATPTPDAPALSFDGALPPDLRDLVYAPTATPAAIARLNERLDRLTEMLSSDGWKSARDEDYATMSERDFWSTPARFEVLDRIERRDRIESARDTAERLANRLNREGANGEFAGRLAQLLFLLGLAIDAVREGRPQDALVEIMASGSDRQRQNADTRLWWQQLLAMYLAWAERRNMRIEILRQEPEHCHAWFAVSGFGALELLEAESGLHVLEQDHEDHPTRRFSLQVRVAPDLPGKTRRAQSASDEEPRICRRYRESPSPLVRDSMRGWRTGRLDRVLGGEFDVMQSVQA